MKSFVEKIKDRFKNIEYNNLYPLFFTIIFILILIQYSFNSLDALFYDLWARGDFVAPSSDKIVVVTMDEESDQFLRGNLSLYLCDALEVFGQSAGRRSKGD